MRYSTLKIVTQAVSKQKNIFGWSSPHCFIVSELGVFPQGTVSIILAITDTAMKNPVKIYHCV